MYKNQTKNKQRNEQIKKISYVVLNKFLYQKYYTQKLINNFYSIQGVKLFRLFYQIINQDQYINQIERPARVGKLEGLCQDKRQHPFIQKKFMQIRKQQETQKANWKPPR
ncbi:hypothetical protein TTHERM_000586580 (macronuclear) [Tetrahymena thermophila SB210]|uniref:Uncharacterized protein n=1 Tax=Tetrahymena thermophila (strain SB210) TaxID=312017 RepID=W7XGT6_TETTS|nr:hypothetical protein TTHERM_000586580 [Tetrahymena thermophila SB210]EWS73436.1 hypothetical protein TTHERM_000586580 [Tetrahymena thermophila SB210]|eukprot:XP_012654007.1 hypothetical protein TTHERM_000586580 [Tetrahymena thermophila SB210]